MSICLLILIFLKLRVLQSKTFTILQLEDIPIICVSISNYTSTLQDYFPQIQDINIYINQHISVYKYIHIYVSGSVSAAYIEGSLTIRPHPHQKTRVRTQEEHFHLFQIHAKLHVPRNVVMTICYLYSLKIVYYLLKSAGQTDLRSEHVFIYDYSTLIALHIASFP